MRTRTLELSVGAFVLAGILSLLFLAVQVSGVDSLASEESYEIQAEFENVGGLRVRSKVSVAGVTIGQVKQIDVVMEIDEALVTMEIFGQPGDLKADATATIKTEGILGSRYISLSPGYDDFALEPGDTIARENTQGALVLRPDR